MNGYYSTAAAALHRLDGLWERLSGRTREGKGKRRKGGSASPPAISGSRRRREFEGEEGENMSEKEVEQMQAACLDLTGEEGREEILALTATGG